MELIRVYLYNEISNMNKGADQSRMPKEGEEAWFNPANGLVVFKDLRNNLVEMYSINSIPGMKVRLFNTLKEEGTFKDVVLETKKEAMTNLSKVVVANKKRVANGKQEVASN